LMLGKHPEKGRGGRGCPRNMSAEKLKISQLAKRWGGSEPWQKHQQREKGTSLRGFKVNEIPKGVTR